MTVYLQKEGFQPIAMWTLAREQDDAWFQGKAGFSVNSDHSILIEAKLTQSADGDIGIDDISITNGYCPLLPAFAAPEGGLTTPSTVMTTAMLVGY